jgi:hypothetical protein
MRRTIYADFMGRRFRGHRQRQRYRGVSSRLIGPGKERVEKYLQLVYFDNGVNQLA